MNKIEINMCDIGFGANRLGIQHGYTMIKALKPELANKINYFPYEQAAENMKIENKKFYNTIYQACLNVYHAHLNSYKNNKTPILLGGDHSLALGSVKASLQANENEDIGLIWIDAHTDIHTFKTSDTGHIHGMPISGLLNLNDEKYNSLGNKYFIKPQNLVYFATRSIDYTEEIQIDKLDILNITDAKIKASSFEKSLNKMINHLKNKVKKVHISLDLDSINPDLIKGVSTPVDGGLTLEQPFELIKEVNQHFDIVAIDIVEYNPLEDIDENTIMYINELINKINNL